MTKQQKYIPELRFPEFENDGEWAEKTLGQVGKFIGGGTPSTTKKEYWDGEIQWYTPTEVKGGKLSESERKITDLGLKNSSAKLLPIGTILITTRATIGDVGITKTKCTTNQGFQSLNVYETEVNKFWLYWIIQHREEFIKRAYGSTFKEINKTEIKKIPVLSPLLKSEQQKIAACLSSLDELITAHEEKLALLQDHKKGLLQNLFPAEGQKVPNYRFPEFKNEGEWVEKKLGEVCKINPPVKTLPQEFIYIDLESVESGVLIQNRKINLENAPSRAQRLLQKDDVIFQMVRPYQKNNYYFTHEDDIDYVASTGYAQLRAFQSSKFLYHYIHTGLFVSKVLEKCTGSNYPAINSSDLLKTSVQIPKSIQEQQKIASCLSSLDELITAETEKIAQLKQHKKGLMQGLFPMTNDK